MHEASIAQNILDYALSEADRNHAQRVKELQLDVGELMQVDVGILRETLKLLVTGPKLRGCRVRLTVKSASFSCNKCSERWGMAEVKKELAKVSDGLLVREPDSKELPLHFLPYLYPAFVHCPRCGSSDVLAVDGEDIRVKRIVLE